MERFAKMALLADFYGPLLTPKQGRIWDLHYEQDFSLVEIAESENISRQAVYDLLKRTEKILHGYEDKLGLIRRFVVERNKLSEVHQQMREFEEKDFSNGNAWERHQSINQKIDEIYRDIEAS
ncbi:YlxM family DNA-binding protein [Desulfitobacterium sp. THU1]|uniref:YlxM family DNA-binding protein n=1 Tax=Desulfitobacterium sp. THU1 TaxID=3138072 RepID=UPI00311F33BF